MNSSSVTECTIQQKSLSVLPRPIVTKFRNDDYAGKTNVGLPPDNKSSSSFVVVESRSGFLKGHSI
jgi:hypothetical protein